MSSTPPPPSRQTLPPNTRIAIAAARFNEPIVEALLSGCLDRLKESGLDAKRIEIHRVPGAFELPLAARMLARSRRFSAVICLGAVIRGQTPHFDFVAGQCARGIQDVAISEMIPVIFGVLTTDNEPQAWDRAGGKQGHAGQRAADAAVEMIALAKTLKDRSRR